MCCSRPGLRKKTKGKEGRKKSWCSWKMNVDNTDIQKCYLVQGNFAVLYKTRKLQLHLPKDKVLMSNNPSSTTTICLRSSLISLGILVHGKCRIIKTLVICGSIYCNDKLEISTLLTQQWSGIRSQRIQYWEAWNHPTKVHYISEDHNVPEG